jgi:DNA modification methylase
MLVLINEDSLKVFDDLYYNYSKKYKIIIVTDPPFNINYKYNNYKDKLKEEVYLNIFNIIKNRDSVLIHYPEALYKISNYIQNIPVKVISWVYNSNTGKQHRDIAFFGVKPDFTKVRQPYKNLNDKRIQERLKNGFTGAKLYDWWFINQVKNVSKEKTKHPCQMPLEVMKNIIGILPEDCLIIDPFMGSGTTGVAVKEMNLLQHANRSFIGIEIDKEYFNIAKERLGFK